MSKNVYFSSKELYQIKEIPKNRTIEIKQRVKNLVSHTKTKLKKRFPNGIKPLIEEKTELEAKINGHETISYRQINEFQKRIDEIDQEFIRYSNLNYVIKNPKDYIEDLDKYRRDSGKTEAKKEKRLSNKSLSPTSLNTKKNKGGKLKKNKTIKK